MDLEMDDNSALPLILLLDDELNVLKALERVLRVIDARVKTFTCPHQALEYSKQHRPDIVISDQHMPQMLGCEFLDLIAKICPHSQRMILSGYQDFPQISAAFNRGTVERFICKPWDNKELKLVVNQAIEQAMLEAPSADVALPIKHNQSTFHGIVASDQTMLNLFANIRQTGTTNAPIFITGETGTGKELVAKACHQEGDNAGAPFIAVNCANFSESLMESQLFGHIKGAFTGAVQSQQGLFAAAGKGTLFLDEITTLSKSLQAKLLRVVQEREFCPLGSNKLQSFDAQIISASHQSIGQAVVDGQFREDLYYRLHVIALTIPPLRQRGDDINLVANYFLKKYSQLENKTLSAFSHDAQQLVRQYDWPGNVRQLENTIHAIVVLNNGEYVTDKMVISALADSLVGEQQPLTVMESIPNTSSVNTAVLDEEYYDQGEIRPLWQIEKKAIEHAISSCQGNIPKAAALLEVSPSTIYRKKLQWEALE